MRGPWMKPRATPSRSANWPYAPSISPASRTEVNPRSSHSLRLRTPQMAPCADDIRSEPMAEMSFRLPSRCAWQSAKPGSTERSPRSMIAASGAPERACAKDRTDSMRPPETTIPWSADQVPFCTSRTRAARTNVRGSAATAAAHKDNSTIALRIAALCDAGRGARLRFLAQQRRRSPEPAPERADEVAEVSEADGVAGGGHGHAVEQHAAGAVEADVAQQPVRRRSDQRPEHAREMEGAHAHGRRERGERVRLVGMQNDPLARQLDAGSVASELKLVVDAMRRLRMDGRFDQLRRPGIERRDAAALQDAIELQAEECEPVAGMEHRYVRSSREPALALDLALESVAEADRHAGIRGYVFEVDGSLDGARMPGERGSAPEAPEALSHAQTELAGIDEIDAVVVAGFLRRPSGHRPGAMIEARDDDAGSLEKGLQARRAHVPNDSKRDQPAPAPGGARNRKLTSCARGRARRGGTMSVKVAALAMVIGAVPALPRDQSFFVEDTFLVTPSGAERISPDLPYSAADLEKEIARRRPK